jgi:hypothetical protein
VFDSLVGRKSPKLEVLTVISEGKLIVTIGVGGRGIMADVGRKIGKPASKDSLEGEGGLALARNSTDGCQYCVAIDPIEVLRMILTIQADDPDNHEQTRKHAREGTTTLAKLGVEGQVALSLRMESERGSLGMLVPKTLLFVDPAKAKKILAIFEALDDAPDVKPAAMTTEPKPAATTR